MEGHQQAGPLASTVLRPVWNGGHLQKGKKKVPVLSGGGAVEGRGIGEGRELGWDEGGRCGGWAGRGNGAPSSLSTPLM